MKNFLAAIHGLHEDTRKFLAGVTIVVLGLGFIGVWTSFISSRLVVLGPPQQNAAVESAAVPVARRLSAQEIAAAKAKRDEPPSPAAGIAASVSGLKDFFARPEQTADTEGRKGFFASVGQGLAAVAETIYMKLAPWVPPYL